MLAQRPVNPVGLAAKLYEFVLNEDPLNGWGKDPLDHRIQDWPSPTRCEFVDVLRGLTEIRVYGDATTEHEVCLACC